MKKITKAQQGALDLVSHEKQYVRKGTALWRTMQSLEKRGLVKYYDRLDHHLGQSVWGITEAGLPYIADLLEQSAKIIESASVEYPGTLCKHCGRVMLLVDDCRVNRIVEFNDGTTLPAVPYGSEKRGFHYSERCHDCAVRTGNYHHPGCDVEECPRCRRQLISCECGAVASLAGIFSIGDYVTMRDEAKGGVMVEVLKQHNAIGYVVGMHEEKFGQVIDADFWDSDGEYIVHLHLLPELLNSVDIGSLSSDKPEPESVSSLVFEGVFIQAIAKKFLKERDEARAELIDRKKALSVALLAIREIHELLGSEPGQDVVDVVANLKQRFDEMQASLKEAGQRDG